MRRRIFDILTSSIGLIMAVVLAVAGGLLLWGHNYIHDQAGTQSRGPENPLPTDSPAIAAPEFAAMHQYAGQQLTTGHQAQVYADHFIANHLEKIGGGKTYSELSSQLQSDPTNTELAMTVNKMFQGETLRGLLLSSYAFWTIGTIAGWAALAAFIGAGVLLILCIFGLVHSRRVAESEELLGHEKAAT